MFIRNTSLITYLTLPNLGPVWPMFVFFLLPIVPALLFFTLIKSTAHVTGRLPGAGIVQDLKFQLGGAFAAYFLTVLLALSTHTIWNPPAKSEVWHVVGQVTDDRGRPLEPLDIKDVSPLPPGFEPHGKGSFKLTFVTSQDDDRQTFPSLSFSHDHYVSDKVDLDAAFGSGDPRVTWDKPNHMIRIKDIKLHPIVKPYSGDAVSLDPNRTSNDVTVVQ